MIDDPRVILVKSDQCMYGLTMPSAHSGDHLPARKRTGFMTSSVCIADELNCLRNGEHQHQLIISGVRSRASQVYPEPLCECIVRGLAKQLLLAELIFYRHPRRLL